MRRGPSTVLVGAGLLVALGGCPAGGGATQDPSEPQAQADDAVGQWYSSDAAKARLDHALGELDVELERPWRDDPRCLPTWLETCEASGRNEASPAVDPAPPTSLLTAYTDYLAATPPSSARARHALDYAERLMSETRFGKATGLLREVAETEDFNRTLRVRAARLLVEARLEYWLDQPSGEGRVDAAIRLRESLVRIQADRKLWNHDSADASALRRLTPTLLASIGWDLATHAQQLGIANGDEAQLEICLEAFTELQNTFHDLDGLDIVLGEAAVCAELGFKTGEALSLRHDLAVWYPDSPLAPDALLWVAETYRDVLMFDDALAHYRKFWTLYPDDERAALARTQWVQLAITLSEPVAKTVTDWREGTADERVLAAAIEFRAAQHSPGTDELMAYLAEYGVEGGVAREIAVHVARASSAMRRSCPDPTRAAGLCTTRALDGRLGEVLTRKRADRREAERALDQALELMAQPDWRSDPLMAAEAPLALEDNELRELEATVALLVGDLSAEEALGVQPPRTYEPTRTQLWLDERKRSVAEMISAYERVGRNDRARVAAAAERTAQVYESDATLLARVEAELRARDEAELATELATLSEARLGQALDAYHTCVDAIARYGADPAGLLGPCRLGVGRLTGVHDLVDPLLERPSLGILALGTN